MIHNNLILQPRGLNNQRHLLGSNNTQKLQTEEEEEEEEIDITHTSDTQSETTINQSSEVILSRFFI
jgi:hypothetical protein